ncbi:putative CRISPR-associated protein [Fimbriiglobus ruber]|uniref:CRISPR-associated protein n=1 Tax=Fimbriiglobus ruber TaxID=1908690 RepID=A0A225DI50_9BACT|nr:putative CRISPR-associated protein [Fimbriiglobus ruber]OWK41121.1 CRISPR-associated protein [Fimbriiglobus ruber]
MPRPILLCTVGTSLFFPNLAGLRNTLTADDAKPDDKKAVPPTLRPAAEKLAAAYDASDWPGVAAALGEFPTTQRLCGAEVNSIASLIANDYAPEDCGIYFFHSDTADGKNIAGVLCRLFAARGHSPVAAVPVPDLQDQDAKRFRTKGLRNLAKLLCAKVREHSAAACAINATGGYKAQIAVAVLLGQAIGLPVYYMHERFSEIIAFPPLPIALDFEVWMRASGLLAALEKEFVSRAVVADEWDERYESLVEVETGPDGSEQLCLSAAGQIFHDTFRERFRTVHDQILPPPALAKKRPQIEKAGWPGTFPDAVRFLERVTAEVPSVVRCATRYYNPDLPEPTRFRIKGDDIEGIFSDGSRSLKFIVETTATSPGQRYAVVAALNEQLASR